MNLLDGLTSPPDIKFSSLKREIESIDNVLAQTDQAYCIQMFGVVKELIVEALINTNLSYSDISYALNIVKTLNHLLSRDQGGVDLMLGSAMSWAKVSEHLSKRLLSFN